MDRITFKCECGDMFTRKNNLQRHKKQSCKISRKPYPERQGTTPKQHLTERDIPENIFHKLNAAGKTTTPLDFHPVEKMQPSALPPPYRNSHRDEDDKSSLDSLRIDASPAKHNKMDDKVWWQNSENNTDESSLGSFDDGSDVSPAEDDEDDNMNRKVWRVILHWGNSNDCSNALDAFKYFFRFNRAMDHDAIIKQIMDSVHAFRDDDDIGFKEALVRALKKRKHLIYRALREHGDESDDESGAIDVWNELKSDGNILEKLRKDILFCRSMKRDPIFRSVKELVQDCMEDIDPMDSDEALDYAVEEKSAAIFEAVNTAHDGSGLFLSPHHKGRGVVDGSSSDRIWEIIAKKNYLDELSSVKFFVQLCRSIDHDPTFQQVWSKTQMIGDAVTFEQALNSVMEKEQSLIIKAFAKVKECEESSSDKVWCLMMKEAEKDDIDILAAFKIYIQYYRDIKNDKVFQAIMHTLDTVIDDMNCNEALDFAVQNNKFIILKAIKKARKGCSPVYHQQPGLIY